MDFLFVGEHPALDFLNTRPVVEGEPVELLASDGDVLRWLTETGLRQAVSVDDSGGGLAEAALTLRESMRDVLEARRLGRSIDGALEILNRHLTQMGPPRLTATQEGISFVYLGDGTEVGRVLALLLAQVVNLFAHADATRTRRCANPECVLWFLDVSKGGRRRWHSMEACGNLHKAREFRARDRSDKVSSNKPSVS